MMFFALLALQAEVPGPWEKDQTAFAPFRECVISFARENALTGEAVASIELAARSECRSDRLILELSIAGSAAHSAADADNPKSPYYTYDPHARLVGMDRDLSEDVAAEVINARRNRNKNAQN
ncbi:hypothetical protein HL653_04085 [Sphingomonas sp. AP4-R1]|uniref:hypothetical protein n=1 Tax=Sphingomonas sp. AP4-R1 TaxID=2735134 RepID=UPI0014937290|nr:hypothetical protein [Sphingomonas sp. AP4-R1]QJU57076.1 hypothetical protein HL653_04085 [Sphingomonas sp. AP4-R1]